MTIEELELIVTAVTDDAVAKLDALAAQARALAADAPEITLRADASSVERAANAASRDVAGLQKQLAKAADQARDVKAWRTLKQSLDSAAQTGDDVGDTLAQMSALCRKNGVAFDGMAGSVADADSRFAALGGDVAASGSVVGSVIGGLTASCDVLRAALQLSGSVSLNNAQALAAIAAVQVAIGALVAYAAQNGVPLTSGGKSSGGSRGGSRSSAPAASTPTASSREPWRDEYEAALEQLDHLKAMDQLSYEQEIARLKKLLKTYGSYADARMELEERIHDARQALANQQADQLDDLADAVLDALKAKYREALEAQRAELDRSRDAVEQWRDASVSAVQSQIDALDELAQAEDRQKTDEAELRNLASLREQIAYEQDEYSRAMLERQLAQAESDRADRLRDRQREDERAALEAQLDAINAEADAALNGLDDQESALQAAYDSQTSDAALRQAVQQALATQSQQELAALVTQYASDYDALGRSFGEQLLSGFAAVVGNVSTWFDGFQTTFAQLQAAAKPTASEAARSVTLNQSLNFNQPVESPSEAARRVAQANEAAAAALLAEM